ncbi:imm11 family protein [Hahella sp. NBU794]|uniref:imm11 family protein n=1 Tax=Hahella sp. NBU794 TaxID=3422590 RepID=UPI003D6F1EE4
MALTVPPPNPLRFTLSPYNPHSADDSHHMPSFFRAAAPVFSDELIAALRECGVDSLDVYDLELIDPDSDQVYTHYKVVNIVSLVSAADMERSIVTAHDPTNSALHDVDFERLVVDPERTNGHNFFRLAESTNMLIAHESVKQHLQAKGFTDLAFYKLGKIAT